MCRIQECPIEIYCCLGTAPRRLPSRIPTLPGWERHRITAGRSFVSPAQERARTRRRGIRCRTQARRVGQRWTKAFLLAQPALASRGCSCSFSAWQLPGSVARCDSWSLSTRPFPCASAATVRAAPAAHCDDSTRWSRHNGQRHFFCRRPRPGDIILSPRFAAATYF